MSIAGINIVAVTGLCRRRATAPTVVAVIKRRRIPSARHRRESSRWRRGLALVGDYAADRPPDMAAMAVRPDSGGGVGGGKNGVGGGSNIYRDNDDHDADADGDRRHRPRGGEVTAR